MRTMLTVLLLCAPCWGQIIVPDIVEPHTPIVAALAVELPEGAQIQGGWSCETAKWIAVEPTKVHVWAPPGPHTLNFRGAWVQTAPVELPDGKTIQALIGFGFIDESAVVTVAGEVEPPPPPPPPPGKRLGAIVEETETRTPQQAALFLQVRNSFGKNAMPILDKDQNLTPPLNGVLQAAHDSQLGLPVLVVYSEDGKVVRTVACPATVEGIREELSK